MCFRMRFIMKTLQSLNILQNFAHTHVCLPLLMTGMLPSNWYQIIDNKLLSIMTGRIFVLVTDFLFVRTNWFSICSNGEDFLMIYYTPGQREGVSVLIIALKCGSKHVSTKRLIFLSMYWKLIKSKSFRKQNVWQWIFTLSYVNG